MSFTQALKHFVFYIPLPYLLLYSTVRVRPVVHPYGWWRVVELLKVATPASA
jgi:hypothetical protein